VPLSQSRKRCGEDRWLICVDYSVLYLYVQTIFIRGWIDINLQEFYSGFEFGDDISDGAFCQIQGKRCHVLEQQTMQLATNVGCKWPFIVAGMYQIAYGVAHRIVIDFDADVSGSGIQRKGCIQVCEGACISGHIVIYPPTNTLLDPSAMRLAQPPAIPSPMRATGLPLTNTRPLPLTTLPACTLLSH
jgi:hypothetical protein